MIKFMLIAILLGSTTLKLNADGRHFVWTYEYQTMPRGEAELETYTEFSHVENDTGRFSTTTLQYEYEVGMTDKFDVGIYQKFQQDSNGPLAYDGFKIRARYRLGEKGRWIVNPLLYVEYKDNAAFDSSVLETKLILTRDFNKLNLAFNPIVEFEFEEDETEIEFEFSGGLSYLLHPLLSLGLEAKGTGNDLYWGPTISHGKNDLWFALGWLTPANKGQGADRKIRFILGVGL